MIYKLPVLLLLVANSLLLAAQSDEIRQAIRNYQYNEAVALLEREPQERENLLLLADCYEKLYNYEYALSVYKQLFEEYPDDHLLLISSAECASKAGSPNLSLQYWLKADSVVSDNLFLQTQLTMAFYRNSKWNETIEQAKVVFEKDSVPMLLRIAGDAYLQTEYTDSAIWFYSKAIEKNPGDYLAVHKLGGIYMGYEFFDGAIDLTDTYLENINPDQQMVGQLNGVANYSAGNYKEAVERFKSNVELGDTSYTTCYYLGMSLYARKYYYEAIPWLEKAYYHNYKDINLLYYFGTTLSRTYDRERGIEVLTEGVGLIGEVVEMLYNFDCSFADAYLRSQNYYKAIEYYQSAYKKRSDDHHHIYNIGYSYDLMGDTKNAISYYERFLKTEPEDIDESDSPADGKYYRAAKVRLEKLREKQFFQSGDVS